MHTTLIEGFAMALSPQTRKELEQELRRHLDAAAAIRHILNGGEPPLEDSRKVVTTATVGSLENEGLRDAMRIVLAEKLPRGMRPSKVAAEMERRGFPVGNAKTPLAVRVGNELWKLANKGKDFRSKNGRYYALSEEP